MLSFCLNPSANVLEIMPGWYVNLLLLNKWVWLRKANWLERKHQDHSRTSGTWSPRTYVPCTPPSPPFPFMIMQTEARESKGCALSTPGLCVCSGHNQNEVPANAWDQRAFLLCYLGKKYCSLFHPPIIRHQPISRPKLLLSLELQKVNCFAESTASTLSGAVTALGGTHSH